MFLLLGNKIDKEDRQIHFEEGQNYAEKNDMVFYETSAKSSIKVEESFDYLLNRIVKEM